MNERRMKMCMSRSGFKRVIACVIVLMLSLVGGQSFSQDYGPITYIHSDFLGNPVAASNEAGQKIWEERYLPFGEKRIQTSTAEVGSNTNRIAFHGKDLDPETGLQYFGARYFEPSSGRFLGVDPVGFRQGNIHSFNRYAYANNNPYKYIDPDGRYGELAVEAFSLSLGIEGFRRNVQAGSYISAAVDGLGVLGDGFLALFPGPPGVLGLGIKAYREASEQAVKELPALRQAYVNEVRALEDIGLNARAAGATPESTARMLHQMRRDLGEQYKNLTPIEKLEDIYARNIKNYNDPLGPSVDWLLENGKSWEQIIESSSRPGGKDLGF